MVLKRIAIALINTRPAFHAARQLVPIGAKAQGSELASAFLWSELGYMGLADDKMDSVEPHDCVPSRNSLKIITRFRNKLFIKTIRLSIVRIGNYHPCDNSENSKSKVGGREWVEWLRDLQGLADGVACNAIGRSDSEARRSPIMAEKCYFDDSPKKSAPNGLLLKHGPSYSPGSG